MVVLSDRLRVDSGAYTYDANGNRLTRTVNGVQEVYAYDDGDKLLDVKVGGVVVKDFDYDLAGRTKEIITSAGTTTFTYDHESRAVTLTGPGVAQTNVYNGLDTRVGSTTNSVANTYLRNGAYVTAPVIKDSNATFTPGVSERRGTTTTFSHSGLKNADAQTGVSQAVNATQQYDAFGNLASSTGTWQGQFGYGGGFGYQQDATGLKLLGHRYYDSSTGRFLTRDPIKDGRNWYAYCDSDPVGCFDNNGLDVKQIAKVGGTAIAIAGLFAFGVKAKDLFDRGRDHKFKDNDARIRLDVEAAEYGGYDYSDYDREIGTEKRGLIDETGQLAAEEFKGNYVYGPGKEMLGPVGGYAFEYANEWFESFYRRLKEGEKPSLFAKEAQL